MKPLAALAAVLVAAVGCLDTDQEYTLNADGSGKVRVVAIGSPFQFNFGGEKKKPEEGLREAVRDALSKSQGVDAWTAVEAKLRDDGKIHFSGTAYFKDLKALKLNILGMQSNGPDLGLEKSAGGGLVVELKDESERRPKGAKPAPGKLGEEELKAKMREERAQYQQSKPLMESFLKELKIRTRLVLPGAVAETGAFKKTAPNAAEIAVEGAAMLKAIDGAMMDDAFLRKQVESGGELGKDSPLGNEEIMERIFGFKGAPKVAVKGPLKDVFDYEAEAAPARAGAEALREKWGAKAPAGAPPAVAPAARGGALKGVRVGGARIVHFQDRDRGISPFNAELGLTLSLVAELPGSVLGLKDGRVGKAVSDAGEDLLPEKDWDREIHFPHLSEDKAAVVFDVKLRAPDAKARGLREVSGVLVYTVGGKTKDVDLGIAEFRKGARGKALGAVIEKIAPSEFDEKIVSIELKLETALETVASVEFLDAAGKPLPVERGGYMSSGDEVTLSFNSKGALPPKGRIVAKLFQDLAQYEAPFKIEQVDLLGRPLK
jgi:hypothetical protein